MTNFCYIMIASFLLQEEIWAATSHSGTESRRAGQKYKMLIKWAKLCYSGDFGAAD